MKGQSAIMDSRLAGHAEGAKAHSLEPQLHQWTGFVEPTTTLLVDHPWLASTHGASPTQPLSASQDEPVGSCYVLSTKTCPEGTQRVVRGIAAHPRFCQVEMTLNPFGMMHMMHMIYQCNNTHFLLVIKRPIMTVVPVLVST
jgi:hypothetical protein